MKAFVLTCLSTGLRMLRMLLQQSPLVVRPIGRWRSRPEVIRLDAAQKWDWQSSGEESYFVLDNGLPLPGWHMLEVGMDYDLAYVNVKLHLEMDGCTEVQHSPQLPLKRGQVTKRLIYIPRGVKALHFYPTEMAGCFTLWHMRIAWLTPRFARDRLLSRLVGVHGAWRGWQKADVRQALQAQAREQGGSLRQLVLQNYDATFNRRSIYHGYSEWLRQRRRLSATKVQRVVEKLPRKPLISILLPVFDPRLEWLRECLDSVLDQYYPCWQLCVADDASANPGVRDVLAEYAQRDARIQVVYRQGNGHVCRATNSALSLADGEVVALLDQDDRLSPYALFRVAEALHRYPDAGLIYSDEDKLDAYGERYEPHFKPRWNPDLLLAQNYISHLGVYRTALVRDVGAFREGFEGSQDHDLALRAAARLSTDQIVHIPHVLYHWRAGEGSTALNSESKGYAAEAGLKAVCQQVGVAEVVMGQAFNSYRVRWPIPKPAPLVTLLIPTRDRVHMLRPCVDAILGLTGYSNFEVLILDNQSRDSEALDYIRDVCRRDSRVRVLKWDQPFNYSAINNFGANHARGSVLGLLNNDVEPINPEWLSEMIRQVVRPEIGCVGAKLYYSDGTIQHGGVILGLGGVAGHSHRYFEGQSPGYFSRLHLAHNLSAVTGACMLVRKDVFQQVGGFNDKDLTVAFNDVDFCLKVREAGYRNLWTPYAELYHHESVSRGADDNPWKRARAEAEVAYMRKTWGRELDDDPAYNPNLTLAYEDFSLR